MNRKQSMLVTGLGLLLMTVLAIAGFVVVETNVSAGVALLSGVMVLDFVVSWSIYSLLKDTNRSVSVVSALLRVVYTILMSVNIFRLATGLEFELFMSNFALYLIVFSFHLLTLGYLLLKADFIPNLLGYIALLGGVAYFADNIGVVFPHAYAELVTQIAMLPALLGELVLAVWITYRGLKLKK